MDQSSIDPPEMDQANEPTVDQIRLSEPVRKGGLPRWAWYGCGCGCLGLFLLVAVMGGAGYWVVKDSTKPEIQWAHLREHLAFEAEPEDLTMIFGLRVPDINLLVTKRAGSEEYSLQDEEDGYFASVKVIRDQKQMALLMDPSGQNSPVEITGGEALTLSLQGKDVQAMRFQNTETKIPFMNKEMKDRLDQGAGIRIDIPRADYELVIDLRSGTAEQAVTQEQIDDFFGHFQLWE